MDKDKKIKELEDWKEFAIKEIFEWHKIAEYLSDKMKVGDYMPTRCLEIIKELEKQNTNLLRGYNRVCEEKEDKALNKENDGLREQNIELLETLADFNKLKEENKKLMIDIEEKDLTISQMQDELNDN